MILLRFKVNYETNYMLINPDSNGFRDRMQ